MKTILLSILTFIAINLSAQSHRFADSSAQWYMTTYDNALWCGGCTSYGTDLYSINGDTTVNGQQYQKINSALIRRDSTQKVYRYFNDNDVMIYDFARNAGDTFTLFNLYGGGMNVSCRVDSVDTVMLNYLRKRMYISYNENTFWHEQWIEGVGSLSSNFLNPGMELMGFDMPSHSLRCFYENDSLLLHTDTADTRCDVDTFIPPPPPYYWFADSNAQWSVLHTIRCVSGPCISFRTYSQYIQGDTIIGGKAYQKISGNESGLDPQYFPFIRRDVSGQVFMLSGSSNCEVLIYDFSAHVGDIVVLNYNCGQENILCRIDSIDSVDIGGLRKRIYVQYGSESSWLGYPTDVWIDGIGTLHGGFLGSPAYTYRFFDSGWYDLRCFSENNNLIYHDSTHSNACIFDSTWVSINEVQSIAASISTNPCIENFILTLSQHPQQVTTLLIHDALGRMIKREELISTTQQVSVADLPDGMYMYVVTQNNMRQASGKLVVSH